MEKWGRFRIVRPKDTADLVFIFDATSGDDYTLTVMDGSYHHVLWAITTNAGSFQARGSELIDLLRQQIESDERTLGKPPKSLRAP